MKAGKLFLGLITAYLLFGPDLRCYISFLKPSTLLVVITVLLFFADASNNKSRKSLTIKLDRKFIKPVVIICIISFYTLLLTVLGGYSLDYNYAGILIPIKIVDFYLLNNLLTKYGYKYRGKINFFLTICSVQSIICIAMLFISPLKNIANILYIGTLDNYYTSDLVGITINRIYGIFGDYTCGGQILMGMAAGVALACYFSERKKIYLIEAALMIISSLLNGRTGTIALIVALLAMLVFGQKYKINVKLVGRILFVFIGFLVLGIVYIQLTDSFVKIEDAIGIINEILLPDKSSTYGSMMIFPEGLSFIFGIGHRIYGSVGMSTVGYSSDYGYINDMFRGGLIYCLIYYFSTYKIAGDYGKYIGDNLVRLLGIVMIVFFALGNYKGEISAGSAVISGIWFISFAIRSSGKEKINATVSLSHNVCL